jgi:hypothetical protein
VLYKKFGGCSVRRYLSALGAIRVVCGIRVRAVVVLVFVVLVFVVLVFVVLVFVVLVFVVPLLSFWSCRSDTLPR